MQIEEIIVLRAPAVTVDVTDVQLSAPRLSVKHFENTIRPIAQQGKTRRYDFDEHGVEISDLVRQQSRHNLMSPQDAVGGKESDNALIKTLQLGQNV